VPVDALRGAAMVCVVFAHAVQRNIGPSHPCVLFLAQFEMALFALVSGYLTRMSAAGVGPWIAGRAKRLLLPFVCWSPIMWLMSGFDFTGLDVLGMPRSPVEYFCSLPANPYRGLWYLPVLFYWCLVALPILACTGRHRRLTAIVGACVAFLAAVWARSSFAPVPIPGDFGTGQLVVLLPYFAAGLAASELRSDVRIPRSAAAVSGLTAFVALWASFRWLEMPSDGPAGAVADLVRGMLGVAGSVLAVASVAGERLLIPLATVGRLSLAVYAMHLLLLRAGFGHGWIKVLTSFAIAVAVPLAAAVLLRRNRLAALALLGETEDRGRKTQDGLFPRHESSQSHHGRQVTVRLTDNN
jgi:fucose 4-O-acetylase-like acetyltransferase